MPVATATFSRFAARRTPMVQAAVTSAAILLASQLILHPIRTYSGASFARTVAGTLGETYPMWTLAA